MLKASACREYISSPQAFLLFYGNLLYLNSIFHNDYCVFNTPIEQDTNSKSVD